MHTFRHYICTFSNLLSSQKKLTTMIKHLAALAFHSLIA